MWKEGRELQTLHLRGVSNPCTAVSQRTGGEKLVVQSNGGGKASAEFGDRKRGGDGG